MASVVSSALQRIHPCCCNTRAPSPQSQHRKTSSTITRPLPLTLFLPPSEGKVTRQIHSPPSAGWLGWIQRPTVCYLSPLLSLSRDEFISQSTAQNRGQGGCTNWNSTQERKKRAYRRKIRLIHRSFQRGFRGGNRRYFSALRQCVFFAWRGDSGGIPVPADPVAPVAAVRTDDDDGDQRQAHNNSNKHSFWLSLSK